MANNHERHRRRVAWFELGAAALRNAYPVAASDDLPAEFYVCPLCTVVATREALTSGGLTYEHVPARHAGGRELVLTCNECNSRGGALLDSHAAIEDAFLNFAAGAGNATMDAIVTVDGVPLRSNVGFDGTTWTVGGVPCANDPAVQTALDDVFERWRSGGWRDGRVTLESRQSYLRPRARLSRLRTAYLAAFAQFGYRYALAPAFEPVRAQLLDPTADIIVPTVLVDPTGDPSLRGFMFVPETLVANTLAVVIGRHAVLLPLEADDPSYFSQVRAVQGDGTGKITLRGRWAEWPRRPMHTIDLLRAA